MPLMVNTVVKKTRPTATGIKTNECRDRVTKTKRKPSKTKGAGSILYIGHDGPAEWM